MTTLHERVAPGDLGAAYRYCGRLTAEHGRSYALATRLLPEQRRPAVHALYGFARTVDDIVDIDAPAGRPAGDCLAELDRIESELRTAVEGASSAAVRPVVLAVADTIRRYAIPLEHFTAFLGSMRMDLPGAPGFRAVYTSMDELHDYMHGSASAIGKQMLPILGTVTTIAEAEPAAAALGEAFQLTNFIRDVGEDLRRGRIYLPADELSAFGVDGDLLRHCRSTGATDPRVTRALAHFVALNRSGYREARPGLAMLAPRVRPGITAAFDLYSVILDEIEGNGYRVLDRRAVVPRRRRLALVAPRLLESAAAAYRG
ncbi:phytoene/squalene synthase family protein [Rhodococcus daqingensis]|uniref:Phytoene/squalene synthase family protein n=1 Tax=Rhodococcus daqingensis TaxID=2479363 RepID=A0ABW2RU33_9NOCA